MLRPNATGAREQWTPKYLSGLALEELLQILQACAPGVDREVFKQKIYLPMCRAGVDGDVTAHTLRSENEGKLNLAHLLQISCAYCIQALAADAEDKQQLARSYLMDAFLYLGMAKTGMSSEPQVKLLQDAVAKDALTTNARRSVSASIAPMHRAEAEARRLILERARAGDRWATPSEAAKAIADEVEQFLTRETPRRFLTRKGRNETIARWLRKMPEAPELFASCCKQ